MSKAKLPGFKKIGQDLILGTIASFTSEGSAVITPIGSKTDFINVPCLSQGKGEVGDTVKIGFHDNNRQCPFYLGDQANATIGTFDPIFPPYPELPTSPPGVVQDDTRTYKSGLRVNNWLRADILYTFTGVRTDWVAQTHLVSRIDRYIPGTGWTEIWTKSFTTVLIPESSWADYGCSSIGDYDTLYNQTKIVFMASSNTNYWWYASNYPGYLTFLQYLIDVIKSSISNELVDYLTELYQGGEPDINVIQDATDAYIVDLIQSWYDREGTF